MAHGWFLVLCNVHTMPPEFRLCFPLVFPAATEHWAGLINTQWKNTEGTSNVLIPSLILREGFV